MRKNGVRAYVLCLREYLYITLKIGLYMKKWEKMGSEPWNGVAYFHTFFCWATIVLPLCKGIFMRSIRHYQPPKRTSNGGVPYVLHLLCLCHRAADDILSMSSHEPYGATASVPPLPYFKSCNNVTISTKYAVNFSQLVLRFNSIVMK